MGFDPRKTKKSLFGLFYFLRDFFSFYFNYKKDKYSQFKFRFLPILSDFKSSSGTASGHYFHQDLWAAKRIFLRNPKIHVDVGSRVDGFIAHLLVFRPVIVLDIRELYSRVDGLKFIQFDITNKYKRSDLKTKSLSCLHSLEHFGLGRYMDNIDVNGWKAGLRNLSSILEPEGILYLSVPIGPQTIEFNAQRIFSPKTIVDEAYKNGLVLNNFSFVDDKGDFYENTKMDDSNSCQYGCGCFEFTLKN